MILFATDGNSFFILYQYNQSSDIIEKIEFRSGLGEMHGQHCTWQWTLYDEFLPYRQYLNKILTKYIHIKPHIQTIIDSFYNENMKGFTCIGVQVRFATKHNHEAVGGHPKLTVYYRKVDELLKKHVANKVKIYIASDSNYVINQFKQRYSNLIYIDAFRAEFNEEPHDLLHQHDIPYCEKHEKEFHQKKPGYIGGLTTLLDCIYLSKCDYFIHTQSNVAVAAVLFNPYIKSIYLPHTTITQCPCTQIVKDRKNPYYYPASYVPSRIAS